MYIIIGVATLLLMLSVFLFFGKGSFLIAGYNTLSKSEKAKYDKKKLCRATACLIVVISVMLYIMAYLGYRVQTNKMNENAMLPFAIIFIIVILVGIIVENIYINKNCRK